MFGWSFYSQGSHSTFTNSQPFFSAVLPFLGITEIPKDEIAKARLLAQCLQQQPCLLILDGLEPLQYPENLPAMGGELQDGALKEFFACFRQLAGHSFVLLSSRQPLVELKKWQPEHFLTLNLKTLPDDDGAALLQALGVTGNQAQRQAISKDLNGHALSLMLLGHLLAEHHQGNYYYAQKLPPLLTAPHSTSDADKDSRHALRVLNYYDSLQDSDSRVFLQLLGLFDRPMITQEKTVLTVQSQHAEPLRSLSVKQWQQLEQRLQTCGLLLGKKGVYQRLEWDTHPIIRAYFGQTFKENRPEAFKQAHLVLFEYFQELPEKEFEKYFPDTLEEMQPLYRAVVHGCLAGEFRQALFEVYLKRILRDKKNYSFRILCAYLQNFMALEAFSQVWGELSYPEQILIQTQSIPCLIALGRLHEAIDRSETVIALSKRLENWDDATINTQNLVTLYQSLGQLNLAHTAAQQAIEYAQLSADIVEQTNSLSYLATVLHDKGNFSEAFNAFQQAEALEQQQGFSYLSSLRGFQYCTLLLESANEKKALHSILIRAEYSLEICTKGNHLLDIALNHLTIAQIHVALSNTILAENAFQLALLGIQKANMMHYTPPFYLARADFYLSQNQIKQCKDDLNSAWEIIERCGMRGYAVDYLLIHGRYSLANADVEGALSHYHEVQGLIQDIGCHRYDAFLDIFASQLCRQLGTLAGKDTADYLQKVKQRIEKVGQWGLRRIIEQDFPAL